MPRGNDILNTVISRILLVGPAKSGKTHYALQAALAGYNILYFDGDAAGPVIARQPKEIRDRIFYFPIHDTTAGGYSSKMAEVLYEFFSRKTFIWNDTKQCIYSAAKSDPDDVIWGVSFQQLDRKTLIVIDSITSLSISITNMIAANANIDMAEMEKFERTAYTPMRNKMNFYLSAITGANCHIVAIGHPDEWEQRRKKPNTDAKEAAKEENLEIVAIREVPVGVSKPHASRIASKFTDVGFLSVDQFKKRKIDFTASPNRDSGGGFNRMGTVEDCSIIKLLGPLEENSFDVTGMSITTAAELQERLSKPKVVGGEPEDKKIKFS